MHLIFFFFFLFRGALFKITPRWLPSDSSRITWKHPASPYCLWRIFRSNVSRWVYQLTLPVDPVYCKNKTTYFLRNQSAVVSTSFSLQNNAPIALYVWFISFTSPQLSYICYWNIILRPTKMNYPIIWNSW